MKILYTFILATLLLTTACDTQLENQVAALVEGKNKWLSVSEGKSYSFTLNQTRHHYRFSNKPIKIKVKNQKIISAYVISSGNPIEKTHDLPTIKSIFTGIFEYIKSCERSKPCNFALIDIEYNQEYGYPVRVKQNTAESSAALVSILVSDVVVE